jgi:hypothetical protein
MSQTQNNLDFFQKLSIMAELVYSSVKQTLDITHYDANWRSGKSTEGKQITCT